MKKYNIFFLIFFNIAWTVFLFLPDTVFGLEFPPSNTCVSGDPLSVAQQLGGLPQNSLNYYFAFKKGIWGSENSKPPITSVAKINFSDIDNIICLNLSESRKNTAAENSEPMALSTNLIQQAIFDQVTQSISPPGQGTMYVSPSYRWSEESLYLDSSKPEQAYTIPLNTPFTLTPYLPREENVGAFGSKFNLKNDFICKFSVGLVGYGGNKGVDVELPCIRYYSLYDGGTGQDQIGTLVYLGYEGQDVPGGFSFSPEKISLQRGEKKTITFLLESDLVDILGVTLSCKNCSKNNITVTPGSDNKTIRLDINATKITDQKIQLEARTVGPLSFVGTKEIPIKMTDVDCTSLTQNQCTNNSECWWYPGYEGGAKCLAKTFNVRCADVPQALCGTKDGSSYCVYLEESKTCTDYLSAPQQSSYDTNPDGYIGPLPSCAFDGSCRHINNLAQVFINFGTLTLGIVGSVALVFFVYGGFMMIISAGNSERVQKGRGVLVAALIGIIVAFSAYAFINVILNSLNVSDEFRVIEDS